MADSNSFHAVCLDTSPPIFYMNDISRNAIRVVEELNKSCGKNVAAYTFDAGPNAVIYYEENNSSIVLGTLKAVGLEGVEGWGDKGSDTTPGLPEGFDPRLADALKEGVSRIILTSVGEGPVKVETHLAGPDGLPLSK